MKFNYQLLADILWYLGHILTGLAVIANHYSYSILAIIFVSIGQFITIISRPIGRIKESN